jgi:hypothetical protein
MFSSAAQTCRWITTTECEFAHIKNTFSACTPITQLILHAHGLAGNTPLHIAASHGQTEAAAALLEAGALVDAIDEREDTCLLLAAMGGHIAAVQLRLQAWQAPAAAVLFRAIVCASAGHHWDAGMLIVRQLGKQDMAFAAQVMRVLPGAVPAALDAVLGSLAEQQAAALQDEARQLAEQRRGLQVITFGLAGMHKRAAAGMLEGPCIASPDECGQGESTAGAADGVSTGAVLVQKSEHASAAAASADDAGSVSVAGGQCKPGINLGHVNKRKRGRNVQRSAAS